MLKFVCSKIKEINQEIEFYKDKIIEERQDIFDYTKTNNILNKYKFESNYKE